MGAAEVVGGGEDRLWAPTPPPGGKRREAPNVDTGTGRAAGAARRRGEHTGRGRSRNRREW